MIAKCVQTCVRRFACKMTLPHGWGVSKILHAWRFHMEQYFKWPGPVYGLNGSNEPVWVLQLGPMGPYWPRVCIVLHAAVCKTCVLYTRACNTLHTQSIPACLTFCTQSLVFTRTCVKCYTRWVPTCLKCYTGFTRLGKYPLPP